MRRRRLQVLLACLVVGGAASCQVRRPDPAAVRAAVPDAAKGEESSPLPDACDTAELGSPERRLTRFELAHAVEDVFGVDAGVLRTSVPRPGAGIGEVPDILVGRLLDVSDRFLVPYRRAVGELARKIASRLAASCPDEAAAPRDCVVGVLRAPASLLWRRTLGERDLDELRGALAEEPRGTTGTKGPAPAWTFRSRALFEAGLRHLLLSPRFYLAGNEERDLRRRLVSRLALVLWSSVPDTALLQKAEAGALDEPAALAAEIARLMAHARFQRFGRELGRQWLRLDRPPHFRRSLEARALVEDPRRFRAIEDELATLLHRHLEERRPVEELLGDGGAGTLLSAGALTAALSTEIREGGNESWLGRGLLVQGALLCRTFPLAAVYPHHLWAEHPLLALKQGAIPRRPGEVALMAMRTTDRPCRECHWQLETIGAVLASFDTFGRKTGPVATSVPTVRVGKDEIGSPAELARWILASGRFEPCLAQKLLSYVLGRAVLPARRRADACLVQSYVDRAGGATSPPTLAGWLMRCLTSPEFRAQGPTVVRDLPTTLPTSSDYLDPVTPLPPSSAACERFHPGRFLVANCGTSACHAPGGFATGFAVEDTAKAAALISAAEPKPDGYCAEDDALLDGTRPGHSLLVRKVLAGAGLCGTSMPIAGGPRSLDPRDLSCFVAWAEGLAARVPSTVSGGRTAR